MATGNPAQTTLRWVLTIAVASFLLGASAVVLIAVDRSIAHQGNALPQSALRSARWSAVVLGIVALGLWGAEFRRARVGITAGAAIALLTVIATPIGVAIAEPDDTPMTVVAFDARTGRSRWSRDVRLLYAGEPMRLDRRGQLVLSGGAPTGRCNTRPDRIVLDPEDGRTISHTTSVSLPSGARTPPITPSAAGDIALHIVEPTRPPRPVDAASINPRLEARDASGRVVWSTLVDGDRASPVIYADAAVVAVSFPRSPETAGVIEPGRLAAGVGFPVYVLDARTGRRRWATEANIDTTPLFSRTRAFTLEGSDLVIRVTDTGKIVTRHALSAPVTDFPDARLERSVSTGDIALVEGSARKLMVFRPTGRVRWTARLPRSMHGSEVAAFGDTVYVSGGARLGYVCGGE